MAASDRIVLKTRNSDISLGTADDAVGTYTTGSLRGRVHAITIPGSWMQNTITAIGDATVRNSKTIQDMTGGSLEWIVTSANRTLAKTLYDQDSDKLFPLRWSPEGTATGAPFYQYLVQFFDFPEQAVAEDLIVLNQTFNIETIEAEGTH